MKIIDLLRLLRKHLGLLILTPILLACLVIFFTKTPSYSYSSETTLYTGIASGSSVEMDKSLSFFATNTAFDNLINVIKSRETQQEVAIRLLAQHLMLSHPNPRFISSKSFNNLRRITPEYVRALVVKSDDQNLSSKHSAINSNDTLTAAEKSDSASTFSFSKLDAKSLDNRSIPSSIDQTAYEQTVKNLTDLALSNDTNFVYNLINYDSPNYSIAAISSVIVLRIASSDLVKLKYTSDDPGICQQTLVFLTEVCIKNYKILKENRSDAVVKYFEFQVNQATQKLNKGEDKLLAFNKDNNIINYYEQSKAVALAKEALDVDYNNMRIKLAGTEAAIKRLEEKLDDQQKVQLKSAPILEKRNQLSQINTRIATAETIGSDKNDVDRQNLASLKVKAEKLKEEIRVSVGELYSFGNTTEGLPISTLLNDWITNVINFEDTKAGLVVLAKRIQEFQKQYEIYAPAGANLKRIEREISVSEQEFLELLHGLNLAKLKMQDIELSSNLKAVDQPYYPASPNPTKRKMLIIIAALLGFLGILSTILALEFFDDTLRNPKKAARILGLLPLGIFPKIYLKSEVLNFPFIAYRLLELMVQRIELLKKEKPENRNPFQILVFSTSNNEGKTVITQNLASRLKKSGNKVIVIRYSQESLDRKSFENYSHDALVTSEKQKSKPRRFSLINWLMGYPDSRVDYQSPFLHEYGSTLSKDEFYEYEINEDYQPINDYQELLARNHYSLPSIPEYVLIEIPSILYYPYPSELVTSVDLLLLVCRANRVWSQADQGAVENITKNTQHTPLFILNGVEPEVVESVLGDLPKKRSWLRKMTKKIIRFQFSDSTLP